MAGKKRLEKQQQKLRQELYGKLRSIHREIDAARSAFNAAGEPELVESCVYNLSALQAQYSYYLRQVRAMPDAGKGNEKCSGQQSSPRRSSSP